VRGIYRTARDPAAEPGDKDPWRAVLPGRYGEVFPFGEDRLAVEVSDPRIAARVAAIRGAIPYQRGEWHWSYTFHVSYLGAVAAIILPAKVRRMSAAAKKRLAAIGGSTGFRALDTALGPASERQDASGQPEATSGPSVAAGAVLARA
jgi:hypothetical protein